MKPTQFNPQKPTAILFVGQSGAGKGTQVQLLPAIFRHLCRVHMFETGLKVRSLAKEDSFAGRQAKKLNDTGKLQPLEWAIMFWMNFLKEKLTGEPEVVIIDGSPRRIEEAQAMERILVDFYDMDVFVIHIIVPDTIAGSRIKERASKENRPESATPEAIKEKLGWYHTQVVPAVEWIKQSSKFTLIEVDGTPEEAEVNLKIATALFKEKI